MTFFKSIEPIDPNSTAITQELIDRIHRTTRKDYPELDELSKVEIIHRFRMWTETIVLLLLAALVIWFVIVTRRFITRWRQTH